MHYADKKVIVISKKYVLSLAICLIVSGSLLVKIVFAQTAESGECTTLVGDPTPAPGETRESLLQKTGCTKGTPSGGGNIPDAPLGSGNYTNPLGGMGNISGIATEMAAYAYDYIYMGHREHAGLDIGNTQRGIPVYAITDGVVTERTPADCVSKFDGCSIQVRHSTDKLISRYTHIDIEPNIQSGTQVRRGQVVGRVHLWPNNNDHLHFELRLQERTDFRGVNLNVNPRNYFPEFQQIPISPGYYGNVRTYTVQRGLPWENDGKEFGNMYQTHPPCTWDPDGCWAQ